MRFITKRGDSSPGTSAWTGRMFGCSRLPLTQASRSNREIVSGLATSGRTSLIATWRFSAGWVPRWTTPMPPRPMTGPISSGGPTLQAGSGGGAGLFASCSVGAPSAAESRSSVPWAAAAMASTEMPRRA
jgi:hypothetical protein